MPLHVIRQQELAKSTGRAGRVGVRSWSKSRLTSTPTSRPLWYSKQPQLRHRANVLYVALPKVDRKAKLGYTERRLLERQDALPVILHADHGPTILHRLVV